MIPFFDLKKQYIQIETEADRAVSEVLESGWFVLGEKLKIFEEEFASYTGSSFAIGVGSGTEAVHLALRAAGVSEEADSLVATVSNTAVATVSAIREAGALPLFIDIDPSTHLMDSGALTEALNNSKGRVKAILPYTLFGRMVNMDHILNIDASSTFP